MAKAPGAGRKRGKGGRGQLSTQTPASAPGESNGKPTSNQPATPTVAKPLSSQKEPDDDSWADTILNYVNYRNCTSKNPEDRKKCKPMPTTGEKLGTDVNKWEDAIKAGQVQAAIEKALMGVVQRGELTEAQAARGKAVIGPTMVIKDGFRTFLAQRIIVFGEQGKAPVVDTYKFAELSDTSTVDDAAEQVIANALADTHIVTKLREPK